jgi:hypothetical protein
MIKEDFVIQASVRRILVRSNIDYSALNFGTVKGVVYFRGLFKLARTYVHDEDEPTLVLKSQDFIRKTLHSFEKKVKSVPGVRDVVFQFINWKKERGQWIPVIEKMRGVIGAPIPILEKKPEGKGVLVEKEGAGEVEDQKGEDEG